MKKVVNEADVGIKLPDGEISVIIRGRKLLGYSSSKADFRLCFLALKPGSCVPHFMSLPVQHRR